MIHNQTLTVASRPHQTLAHRRRPSPIARERTRLRAHFKAVLEELRGRDVSGLDASQRARRGALIAELARYAAAGVFPRNVGFPGRRVPHFVDAVGTPCAMAHLIATSGHGELVARISGTANYAYIRELADDAGLQRWLEWAGLGVAEAARIQPSYCLTPAEACLCQAVSAEGVLEGTVVSQVENDEVVRVDAVHGDVGTIKVGDEIVLSGGPDIGDTALVEVSTFMDKSSFGLTLHVGADGIVELDCMEDVPPLAREDAIAALLTGSSGPCNTSLAEVDPAWGEEEHCEGGSGLTLCGCTTEDTGGTSFATLLLVAAWWARRRRARRR